MRLHWELARRGYRTLRRVSRGDRRRPVHEHFFGFLIAYVLLAVYDQRDEVGGYDVADALDLRLARAGAARRSSPASGRAGTELGAPRPQRRRRHRPVPAARPAAAFFAQDLGRAAYQALCRAAPQFVLGALVFEITAPGRRAPLARLRASASCLAIVVSFAVRFLVNLSAFWLLDYRGAAGARARRRASALGPDRPALLLPRAVGDVARALPFAAMLQAPIDVYVGEPLGGDTAGVLLLQAVWAVRAAPRRPARARGRDAEAGGAGWLSWRGSTSGSSARACAASSSTGCRWRSRSSRPRADAARLRRDPRPLRERPRARRLARRGGRVALRARGDLLRARRPLIGHLDLFPQMIRDGTFDQILVRPLPSLLQVVASDFSLRRLGKLAQGIACSSVALVAVDVDWTLGRALMLPLAVVSGAAHLLRRLDRARRRSRSGSSTRSRS